MANDNVTANAGSGGATFRTFSDGTLEWPASVPSYITGGSANSWTLQQVDSTHGLPVSQQGTWNIGTVTTVTAVTTVSTVTSLSQFAGNAISTGNGASGTGVLRVTLANDSTGVVAATQSGTWTVQPGNTANTTPWLVGHGKTLKTVSNSLTADTDVIAAVSSKRLKVFALTLVNTGTDATLLLFKSNGTGGTELWRTLLQGATGAPMGYAQSVTPPGFLFATAAGEKLTIDTNQTDTIHYSIAYWDDDAT